MKKLLNRLIAAVIILIGSFSLSESEVFMPYIPQVKIGNDIFDVKDKEARNQIDFIKSSISKKIPAVDEIKDYTLFEYGGLLNGQDDSYLLEKRCRTTVLNAASYIYIKSNDSTAQFGVHVFDDIGNFVEATAWQTQYIIQKGTRFRLVLYVNDSSALTIKQIFEHFTFESDDMRSDFERGSLNDGVYDVYSYQRRVISRKLQHAEKPVTIVVKNRDAAVNVNYYTENGAYADNSGWHSGRVTIPYGSYYRLLLDANTTALSKWYYSVDEILSNFIIIEGEYINITDYIDNGSLMNLFTRGTAMPDETISNWHIESRICSSWRFICDDDLLIQNSDGVLSASVYNEQDGSLLYERYWPTSFYVRAGSPFAITLTKDPYNNTPETIYNIYKSVQFKKIKNNIGSLSPNIIWQCRNVDDSIFPPYSKWYIQAAAHNQYDRVRVNVRNTTDGEFVLIHDDTINTVARNRDGSVIEQTISSDGHTLAELNQYDWGIKYGPGFAGFGVPTLEDACKYASLFNLGLSLETYQTAQSDIDKIYKIASKYGLLENLFILPASQADSYITACEYWNSKSPYISFVFGFSTDMTQSRIDRINAMKTEHNNIYVSTMTWGTMPTEEEILFAANNGWRLYSSAPMNYNELINLVGVDTGHTLIEVNNVYMIKETMRKYADTQVE